MRNSIKSICIVTSPFGCIPPHAIGAVEKLWKSCGDYFQREGIKVTFLCKKPDEHICSDSEHIYIKGYGRTGSWIKDFLLDFIYSVKALWLFPKSDAIVLNTIWSPVLAPLFKYKYKISLYNVARFPKHQFWAYKGVDALSCVSMAVYECLLEQTPSARRQACMISNFIDTDIFRPRKQHILSSSPLIVYSGRVHREKGLDILVRAITEVRKVKDVSLKIIGGWKTEDGGSGRKYKSELDEYAKEWNIEWVDPIYNPEELASEMDRGDLYCYPSTADSGETFGVAPLEAMGLGLPTIVSSLYCFKDFVKDKVNGLIFDHHADDAVLQLANCILTIIMDENLYRQYSENAIDTARTFSIENKSNEYLMLLNNLYRFRVTGFSTKDNMVKEI